MHFNVSLDNASTALTFAKASSKFAMLAAKNNSLLPLEISNQHKGDEKQGHCGPGETPEWSANKEIFLHTCIQCSNARQ